MNILWTPQKKQIQFLERNEYEALYGGAAGGGKSDALLAEALRQVAVPHYKAIIFRKTMPQCRELIDRSLLLYKNAFPKAVYNSTSYIWTFPSGASIQFASIPHANDRLKYQGQQFDFIGFDELTHFTWEEYSYLMSRNRPSGKNTRCYIRATCNPGGIGHAWVKKRFIEGKEPMVTYTEEVTVRGKKHFRSRIFIPSTVFDNKILLENDPNYVANLAMLPESERRALLDGDWDSFNGQVFSEFRNDSKGYESHKFTHVIPPFEIPETWRRYRSFDFGYSKPFAVQWWAVDNDGRVYLYRQFYGCTDTPNTGLRLEPSEIARKIREIEDVHENGRKIYGVADPSIWDTSRGTDGTVITMFEREGIYFDRGNNARIAGKMQLHYRLRFDNEGYPMMYIFDTCKPFLRTITSLVYDASNPEDIDTRVEDHDYDACRYFLMTNPISPKNTHKQEKAEFNPLDL